MAAAPFGNKYMPPMINTNKKKEEEEDLLLNLDDPTSWGSSLPKESNSVSNRKGHSFKGLYNEDDIFKEIVPGGYTADTKRKEDEEPTSTGALLNRQSYPAVSGKLERSLKGDSISSEQERSFF